jgi:predicted regulator of Ras-like GTPase activity (Roadblock/LC7/MglB family)
MFSEFFDSIVGKVEGTLGVLVMGMDGISIEKRVLDSSVNIESLAAEYTAVLRASSSTTQDVGLGTLEELIVSTDQRIAVIRMITPEYFVFILLKSEGNLGRARFELKKARLALAKEFAI